MYSKLGGCLGDTTKLGPLSRTDHCAWVKGLLNRFMTHLGLGCSEEDHWGSLLGRVGVGAFLEASATCLGSSAIPLGGLGALCLAECLTACLSWGGIACLGSSPVGVLQEETLASWEVALSPACLPAWGEPKLLPTWEVYSWEEGLLGGSALTAWEVALSPGRWGPACLGSH